VLAQGAKQSTLVVTPMPESAPLLRVCQLLNEAGARYLVCGAHACILHGLIRTTEDVDILVEPTEENWRLVAVGRWRGRRTHTEGHLGKCGDKVADEVEVDVSTQAWRVTYADAIATAKEAIVAGVRIPFLSLDSLIASKETSREQDALDRLRLLELKRRSSGN
jgi:hypothetical protein